MTTSRPFERNFSVQLCGNPLAYALKAVSRPESPVAHDNRSRDVPVKIDTAFAAVPPYFETFGLDRPALGAGLRGAARIDHHDRRAGTFSLVRREMDESRPRSIVNRSSQHPPGKPGHVEVFKSDGLITGDQKACELMQMVAPLASNLGGASSKTRFGLEAPPGSSLASSKRPLSAALRFLSLASGAGRFESIAITRRNQSVKPKIDANRFRTAVSGELRFNTKYRVPFALLASDNGRPEFSIGREITVPNGFNAAWHPYDANTTVFLNRQTVTDSESSGVVARRCTETREAVLALKECSIGFVQPPQDLLQGSERPSPEAVRVVPTAFFQLGALDAVTETNAAPAISFNPLLQASVVQTAKVNKHLAQGKFLRFVRPQSVLVAANLHLNSCTPSNPGVKRADGLPVSTDAPAATLFPIA